MTANPLARRAEQSSSLGLGVSLDLQTYCDDLNAMHCTREAGWQWFVNSRRRDDGSDERFVDRRDRRPATDWSPSPAETQATHEVATRAIEHGVTMEQFASYVRRGVISREIDKIVSGWNGDGAAGA